MRTQKKDAARERRTVGRWTMILTGIVLFSCRSAGGEPEDPWERKRAAMVEDQLQARDITAPRVLDAMRKVPRHLFIPAGSRGEAYDDHPVPIGLDQTISQPYIVASMTQSIQPQPGFRVLEIGTGSGYQAAVLAELVKEVYTIEILPELGERAQRTLGELGYRNVHVRVGDGYAGWPEAAPFDAILVTAAPREIPPPLLDQLKVGGVLIAPVGVHDQDLVRVRRTGEGFDRQVLYPVRFVPMTGRSRGE